MNKTISERGKFKEEIHAALYNSENICNLLLGDISNMNATEIREGFKKRVKSHLFIDDTIEDTDTFIFYDVVVPSLAPNIKSCRVIVYAICHRDILDDYYMEGYYGNRADILSEIIEEVLTGKDVTYNFGIGKLTLDSVDIYNSTRFYGCVMTFNIPTFR